LASTVRTQALPFEDQARSLRTHELKLGRPLTSFDSEASSEQKIIARAKLRATARYSP
jgi:hypothetical protein